MEFDHNKKMPCTSKFWQATMSHTSFKHYKDQIMGTKKKFSDLQRI